jgi:hypothetical protein
MRRILFSDERVYNYRPEKPMKIRPPAGFGGKKRKKKKVHAEGAENLGRPSAATKLADSLAAAGK